MGCHLLKCRVRGEEEEIRDLSLLPCRSFSFPHKLSKSLKRLTSAASILRLVLKCTSICTQSVSGAVRQRGSILLLRKKWRKKKWKNEKISGPLPPSPVVCGLSWSHTVRPLLGGHPNPLLLRPLCERGSGRAGGSAGWEWRAGRKPAEREGPVNKPRPSWFSPKDGAGGGFDWGRSGHQQWTFERDRADTLIHVIWMPRPKSMTTYYLLQW